MKIKIIILITFSLLMFSIPPTAQGALVKCGMHYNDPAIQKANECTLPNLFQQIFKVVSFLIGSATLLTVGYILFGGIKMILARGNPTAVADAQSTMTNAIIGLIIVLLAYLIVSFVIGLLSGGRFSFSTIPKILNLP